jgi:hypothetical protein
MITSGLLYPGQALHDPGSKGRRGMNEVIGACVKNRFDIRRPRATCEANLFEEIVLVPKGTIGVITDIRCNYRRGVNYADVQFQNGALVVSISCYELAPASPLIALAMVSLDED